jgi:hypothetical protein
VTSNIPCLTSSTPHSKFLLFFVPTTGDLTLVNVDTKMSEDSTDAVVVHGTHPVYVAVLSEALCLEVHLLAHHALGCVLSLLSMSLKESNLREE